MSGDGIHVNLWLGPEWETPMQQIIESVSNLFTSPENVAYNALVHSMVTLLKEVAAAGEATPGSHEWWTSVQQANHEHLIDGQ